VDTERKITVRVIERLKSEYAGQPELEAYFWEYEPMLNYKAFQDQIPATSEFDLVICILWSRLGTPLKAPDGRVYAAGTEYEVESAKQSFAERGRPGLMIYWNKTAPRFPAIPREERDKLYRQFDALVDFLDRNSKDIDTGFVKGAVMSYRDLGEF